MSPPLVITTNEVERAADTIISVFKSAASMINYKPLKPVTFNLPPFDETQVNSYLQQRMKRQQEEKQKFLEERAAKEGKKNGKKRETLIGLGGAVQTQRQIIPEPLGLPKLGLGIQTPELNSPSTSTEVPHPIGQILGDTANPIFNTDSTSEHLNELNAQLGIVSNTEQETLNEVSGTPKSEETTQVPH